MLRIWDGWNHVGSIRKGIRWLLLADVAAGTGQGSDISFSLQSSTIREPIDAGKQPT